MIKNGSRFQSSSEGGVFEAEEGDPKNLLLVLGEEPPSEARCQRLAKVFGPDFKLLVSRRETPSASEVPLYTGWLLDNLRARGVRRLSVLGYGSGGSLAQALALEDSKLVRRLILLDASSRLRPSLFIRLLDRLERILPLGLPFRNLSSDFDSRSTLHRITSPVLILSSAKRDNYLCTEAALLADRIPNSWLHHLDESSAVEQMEITAALAKEFIKVSPKQPQKNRA